MTGGAQALLEVARRGIEPEPERLLRVGVETPLFEIGARASLPASETSVSRQSAATASRALRRAWRLAWSCDLDDGEPALALV